MQDRTRQIQAKPYRFVERHEDTDELNKIKQTELNFVRLDVVRQPLWGQGLRLAGRKTRFKMSSNVFS